MSQTEKTRPQNPSVQFCVAWAVSHGKKLGTDDRLPVLMVLSLWVATPLGVKGPLEDIDFYTMIHNSCKVTVMK